MSSTQWPPQYLVISTVPSGCPSTKRVIVAHCKSAILVMIASNHLIHLFLPSNTAYLRVPSHLYLLSSTPVSSCRLVLSTRCVSCERAVVLYRAQPLTRKGRGAPVRATDTPLVLTEPAIIPLRLRWPFLRLGLAGSSIQRAHSHSAAED